MILVTGGAGFIGSALVWQLNQSGIEDIIVSDKLHSENKWQNLVKSSYYDWVDRDRLFKWLRKNGDQVDAIVHMGACSATTEKDVDFLMRNNYEFTKRLWKYAVKHDKRFIYASSAATYGMGENGYSDAHDGIKDLKPLNPYGYSKQIFDQWALKQKEIPKQWVGLKFFNVYGPNEYHKKRMASVIFHAFHQVKENGQIKLFKSHKEGYEHGMQLRDFVYVKDVVKVIEFFIKNEDKNGIYNLGTGKARAFKDLAENTMKSAGHEPVIEYIDMPVDIRDKYQYFTEADMQKLQDAGYTEKFYSLEEGVNDYVSNYLMKEDPYL